MPAWLIFQNLKHYLFSNKILIVNFKEKCQYFLKLVKIRIKLEKSYLAISLNICNQKLIENQKVVWWEGGWMKGC